MIYNFQNLSPFFSRYAQAKPPPTTNTIKMIACIAT